jgi:hypothetical protein
LPKDQKSFGLALKRFLFANSFIQWMSILIINVHLFESLDICYLCFNFNVVLCILIVILFIYCIFYWQCACLTLAL